MAELATSHVKKLVTEKSGGMRISATALPEAIDAGAAFLRKLGEVAGSIARGYHRKTIMPEDIEAAMKQIWPY